MMQDPHFLTPSDVFLQGFLSAIPSLHYRIHCCIVPAQAARSRERPLED